MRSRHGDPVRFGNLAAALLARYPMTPERAAANARLLDEEVAAYEAEYPDDAAEIAA